MARKTIDANLLNEFLPGKADAAEVKKTKTTEPVKHEELSFTPPAEVQVKAETSLPPLERKSGGKIKRFTLDLTEQMHNDFSIAAVTQGRDKAAILREFIEQFNKQHGPKR